LNLDGRDEIELRNRWARVVVNTVDGGTVEEIDFRPANANVVNSLQRRPEVYHKKIRDSRGPGSKQFPTKEMSTVKEAGLDKALQYDRYGRSCCRLYLFSGSKNFGDFEAGRLEEWVELAAGEYRIVAPGEELPHAAAPPVVLEREMRHDTQAFVVRKCFTLADDERAARFDCAINLGEGYPRDHVNMGIEMVINFLAPDAPDRSISSGKHRSNLAWAGHLKGSSLELRDEWKDVRVKLEAPGADEWWVRPIYTVSQSEGGFERVYQGSSILAVWRHVPPQFSLATTISRARAQ
jgi:alpha-amylase